MTVSYVFFLGQVYHYLAADSSRSGRTGNVRLGAWSTQRKGDFSDSGPAILCNNYGGAVDIDTSEQQREIVSKEEIKHRSLIMGIRTGDMPDVELIWEIQRDENHEECFGQGARCSQRNCRWRRYCTALHFFAETTSPRIESRAIKRDAVSLTS